MTIVSHILHIAAALSIQESRMVYVFRAAVGEPWKIDLQLSCPCCLLAMVAGRQVIRWMHS